MECDCKPDSPCTSSSSCGEETDIESAVKGLWIDANTLLTGLISVVGYLLFRCSQALPRFLSWPVRIFCSLTGISSLWSWLTNLVKAVRGLHTVFHWLARLWRFLVAIPAKFSWLTALIKVIAGVLTSIKQGLEFVVNLKQRVKGSSRNKEAQAQISSNPASSPKYDDPGLRVIVVSPQWNSRRSLVSLLLGPGTSQGQEDTQECRRWRRQTGGREVMVVETPDLLGTGTLGTAQRAREALRSLQMTSPGPHAFLFALRCSGATTRDWSDAANALDGLAELVGEGALGHVLVVLLAQAEGRGRARTLSQLLEEDAGGGLRAVLSTCGQRAELVDGSREAGGDAAPRLLERVVEMRALRGHYVHELQRREERIRQELLADMAHILTQRLEGNWG